MYKHAHICTRMTVTLNEQFLLSMTHSLLGFFVTASVGGD